MKNVVILDLDGVLIITPSWKADEIHPDGYSAFDSNSVRNLNDLLDKLDAELWLSSSRRLNKTLDEFREIFANRKILKVLAGFLPIATIGTSRRTEIETFLDQEPIRNFLILDDDQSLQGLSKNQKANWVNTNPLIGFNTEKLIEAKEKIKNWNYRGN